MDINTLKTHEKSTIDLHGLTVEDAELDLIDFLEQLPKEVRAVEVTHGYSRGVALKRMVRNDFYHWRVRTTQVSLNPGSTWLILK